MKELAGTISDAHSFPGAGPTEEKQVINNAYVQIQRIHFQLYLRALPSRYTVFIKALLPPSRSYIKNMNVSNQSQLIPGLLTCSDAWYQHKNQHHCVSIRGVGYYRAYSNSRVSQTDIWTHRKITSPALACNRTHPRNPGNGGSPTTVK